MLSITFEVLDIKRRLRKDYSFYSYTSDSDFEDDIEMTCEDVSLVYVIPRIGLDIYNEIAEKDKAELTLWETYVYLAEVYATCYEFIRYKIASDNQLTTSTGGSSLSVEGYSYKEGSASTSSSSDSSLRTYRDWVAYYLGLAGFNVNALERTCTIFGEGECTDYDKQESYTLEN